MQAKKNALATVELMVTSMVGSISTKLDALVSVPQRCQTAVHVCTSPLCLSSGHSGAQASDVRDVKMEVAAVDAKVAALDAKLDAKVSFASLRFRVLT